MFRVCTPFAVVKLNPPVAPVVATVCVEDVEPLKEAMPVADEQVAHASPPCCDEEAVRHVLSEPTAFVVQVVPEATIKLPVVVARLLMSKIRVGTFKVMVFVEVVISNVLVYADEVVRERFAALIINPLKVEVERWKLCVEPVEVMVRPVPDVAKVCVLPTKPFKEEIPEPPAEDATSQEIPPGAVEDAVSTFPSAPTPFTVHVLPEATIKLPVVVARLLMSFTLPGKLKVRDFEPSDKILNPPA